MEGIPERETNEPPQEQTSLRPEHLAEGFYPIMACVGTLEQYGGEVSAMEDIENIGHNVNFSAHPDLLEKRGFKNAGHGTYVMSPIDGDPKFTRDLLNCSSLIAVGRDKITGAEISFMTHQNPGQFLGEKKDEFSGHLIKSLLELKKRCEKGSVDIVVAGGNINFEVPKYTDNYVKSLKRLGAAVQKTFGFNPMVVSGPKDDYGDNVYFDTKERRAYIIRPPNSDLHNDSFRVDKVDKKIKEWEAEHEEQNK